MKIFSSLRGIHVVSGLGLTGLLVVSVMATGCSRSPENKNQAKQSAEKDTDKEKLPEVQTVKVKREKFKRTIEVPGTVEGFETTDLYAKVGGYLDQIPVDIGDSVKKGKELAKLRIPEMAKQVAQKNALLEQAKTDQLMAKAAWEQAKAEETVAAKLVAEAEALKKEKAAELTYRQTTLDLITQLVASRSTLMDRKIEAQFHKDTAEAAVVTAEAKINIAKARATAAEKMTAKARADMDSAQKRTDVAQADLEYLQELEKYAVIRAPFDGMIVQRWVHPGAFIQPAEGNSAAKPLLTITRVDELRIVVELPMSEVPWLDKGDKAMIRMETLPGDNPLEASVTRFSPALNATSRTMRVELDVKNRGGRIAPGSIVYVNFELERFPKDPKGTPPVVIPTSALLQEDGKHHVFVVKDGVVQKQQVEPLYKDGQKAVIGSDLQEGEEIVSAGVDKLADGKKVRVKGS